MLIKDIKDSVIRMLAREEQELQGNTPDENIMIFDDQDEGNFNWSASRQGSHFWGLVSKGKYTEAYKECKDKLSIIDTLK